MQKSRTISTDQPSTSSTFPLTISVLNRIFDFAATDARDAILRLGLVNQQWKDTLLYAPAMWKRFMVDQWQHHHTPDWKKTTQSNSSDEDDDHHLVQLPVQSMFDPSSLPFFRTRRWTMQSFKMHYISQVRGRAHAMSDFMEIENCGGDQLSEDTASSESFEFVCPVLAQHLRLLENEVNPSNGLNLMFCSICRKKVHPVTNDREAEEAAREGRCVTVMIPPGPAAVRSVVARINNHINDGQVTNDDGIEPRRYHFYNSAVDSDKREDIPTEVLNFAIVYSKSSSSSSSEFAQNALRQISRHFAEMDIDSIKDYDGGRRNNSDSGSVQMSRPAVCRFLSANALDVYFPVLADELRGNRYRPKHFLLRCRTVEVDPAPKSAEGIQNLKPEHHPASSNIGKGGSDDSAAAAATVINPLSNAATPASGGWQFLICVDPESSRWFTNVGLFTKITPDSYIRPLAYSARLFCVLEKEEALITLAEEMKRNYVAVKKENKNKKRPVGDLNDDDDDDLNDDDDAEFSYVDDASGYFPWEKGWTSSDEETEDDHDTERSSTDSTVKSCQSSDSDGRRIKVLKKGEQVRSDQATRRLKNVMFEISKKINTLTREPPRQYRGKKMPARPNRPLTE